MEDVGCVQYEATTIICNNQGSMALAKKPTNHDRLKYIDVQYHCKARILPNAIYGSKYSNKGISER